MAALVLTLLVVVAGYTWAGIQPGALAHGQQVTWSGSLLDRLDVMERLMVDQHVQMTRHDVIISQTKSELSKAQTELSETKTELAETKVMLSKTENRLRETKNELADTKVIVIKTETSLSETKTELSKTKIELSNTHKELSDTKLRLHQLEQAVRLCPQQSLEPQQSKTNLQQYPPHQQGRGSQPSRAESIGSTDHRVEEKEVVLADSRNATDVVDVTENLSTHDVMSRADDSGPLEVVVNQLGQKVTEMGADIAALKTQTGADITDLRTLTNALQNTNSQQDNAIQDAQSSTYTHWGRSQCANVSNLVYSGIIGGSWYGHSGAATNNLCLTMTPVFSNHQIPAYLAYLHGGEYETFDSHYNQDPVCAVCRSSFSTTVMIPGTNICTSGWHRLYSGFLMAGDYRHAAGSEYICVDSNLESSVNSGSNHDGKVLYYTVTQCGTLPCLPYVNNKIVTCVVCGK